MSDTPTVGAIPVIPCNDMEASRRFWERLGFAVTFDDDEYKILRGWGCEVHLQPAVPGWLRKGESPFAVYLRLPDVEAFHAQAPELALGPPSGPADGMFEAAFSDPDENLVTVGWPSRLRQGARS